MSAITRSVGWWCFVPQLLTPEQFVLSAAEAGFRALDLVPPEYWRFARDRGPAISSIVGHQSIIPKGEPAAALRTVFQQCVPWL
jgi:hypothetical protein